MTARCEVWRLVRCPLLAVETLVFLNPLCAGKGSLAVCEKHLAQCHNDLLFG